MYEEIDLYKILEVNEDACLSDIKKSYKKLILKYHPDKSTSKNHENFIKLKHAYDILSNKVSREKYDNNKKSKENDILLKYLQVIKNIVVSKEYINIYKILFNKIYINNENLSLKNIYNNNIFRIITNINLEIDYNLNEVWNNIPKLININRITNNIFQEYIFPIDRKQIYENEGENIQINNESYVGNIIVEINVNETYNEEKYFIDNSDLYLIVNKNRINNDKIEFKFINDEEEKINLSKLKLKTTNYGELKCLENHGLPYYDTKDEIICGEYNVLHGNLYFIIIN
jgi:DnaJ-class molecular chaperone